jgi:transcriptional repressor NrdR
MEKLATVNEVAYVRFASVYRRFKDIASFEKELSQIRSLKNEKIT